MIDLIEYSDIGGSKAKKKGAYGIGRVGGRLKREGIWGYMYAYG